MEIENHRFAFFHGGSPIPERGVDNICSSRSLRASNFFSIPRCLETRRPFSPANRRSRFEERGDKKYLLENINERYEDTDRFDRFENIAERGVVGKSEGWRERCEKSGEG